MKASQLLRRSHQRLLTTGLLGLSVLWSLGSLLWFYWPSQVLLSPWSARLSAATRLDLAALRLLLGEARQIGLLGWISVLFLLRWLLTPAVEAFVFGRLMQMPRKSIAFGAFYRLHVLVTLSGCLVALLIYVSRGFWLDMLQRHPLHLALPVLLGASLAWFAGWLISWRRSSLAAGKLQITWPPLSQTLSVGFAQSLLGGGFGLALLSLNRWLLQQEGMILVLALLLASIVRTYGRLWKLACAVSAWQDGHR